jgi:hypothetical protein
MLAAKAAAADGRAREITSDFPRPVYSTVELRLGGQRVHDPRSTLIQGG